MPARSPVITLDLETPRGTRTETLAFMERLVTEFITFVTGRLGPDFLAGREEQTARLQIEPPPDWPIERRELLVRVRLSAAIALVNIWVRKEGISGGTLRGRKEGSIFVFTLVPAEVDGARPVVVDGPDDGELIVGEVRDGHHA